MMAVLMFILQTSSYLSHSCVPSAKISFPKNNANLHLIALEDIAKGQEITVAYVDVAQVKGEEPSQSRQRRRAELARGWKLGCACPRCVEEGNLDNKKTTPTDGSLVELHPNLQAAATAAAAGASR